MADVDPAVFRQLLGRFATGVVVVTTLDRTGRSVGMTANSLASVSLVPPLVSICIDRAAHLYAPIISAPHFTINVLAEDQEEISRRFAGPHEGRFDGVGYHLNERGLVLLDGALAYIDCNREAVHEAGDHVIVVGRVIGGMAREARPLLYFRGGYGSLG
ncbi:MAG TPA: flavin reductase family protein [Gemmatimonadales bacterium]|nr:flavin reductase family protein [Gemmatimonadales bacterium]